MGRRIVRTGGKVEEGGVRSEDGEDIEEDGVFAPPMDHMSTCSE